MTDEATYQIVFEKKAGKRAYLCTGADGKHYVADKQKDAAKFNSHYEATQVMAREYRIAVGTPRVVKQPRMSKAVHRLTAKKIEKLKDPGRFHDGDGLYLQITPSGSRSWLLRYQRGGKEHMFGLGPLRTFSLKEARERAREVRQRVKDGEDPIEARETKRREGKREIAKRTTFRKAAEDYLKTHEGEWRNEVHRRQWRQTLDKYVYPVIGDKSVAAIDDAEVLEVLRPIWLKRPVTAQRIRGRMERVLDFAKVKKWRTGENPARWRGHLDHLLQKPSATKKHLAAMPFEDLPAFLVDLRAQEGAAARALEVAILTATRTGEILGARWSEVDLAKREWTIPPERMKAGREHKVPLSARVQEILSGLPREEGTPFVFIGGTEGAPLHNMALLSLLRDIRPGLTVHGFRSSFSTWAHEKTNTSSHVIEMALAHTVGSAVERAYRRSDLFEKRRQLMEAWEYFCSHPEASREVVQLFGR